MNIKSKDVKLGELAFVKEGVFFVNVPFNPNEPMLCVKQTERTTRFITLHGLWCVSNLWAVRVE